MKDEREIVTVTIDGIEMQAPKGELLIRVAQDNGTFVPRFCWHERMKPVGMCRMCLVEVEGVRGMPPACTTTVTDGMVVNTKSETVKKAQHWLDVTGKDASNALRRSVTEGRDAMSRALKARLADK